MEIDFNKEERTKTSEFVKFSIREYVAGIRKKDRKKCWPFGSLGDPGNDEVFASYQFLEHSEAAPHDMIESLGIDDNKGKTVYEQENSINYEGGKLGSMVAADNDEFVGRNLPRKKAQKFRLLSDIMRDLAGPTSGFHVRCNITNPDNVNGRFATETEDESDDITLDAFFRKQKGVEVKRKKKKMMMIRVEEPRIDREKRSKRGSEDSNENDSDFGVGKRKDRPLENRYTEVCSTNAPTKTANEDSEMEAVMLLASHFNEETPRKPANGSKNAQMAQSDTRKKAEIEPLETSSIQKRNLDQRLFANADISSDPEMGCACVKKKIRKISISDGNYESTIRFRSSKTVTNDQDFFTDTQKKISKEKLEIGKMKVGRVEWDAKNRVNLVCMMNRNPADISVVNSENEFMRRG